MKNFISGITLTISMVSFLFCAVMFVLLMTANQEPVTTAQGEVVSSAMSPCQCKVAGGCGILWVPKDGALYSDETDPQHYDQWGVYSGPEEVPMACRNSGSGAS